MPKLLVERWTSGEAEEIHWFVADDQRGYAYVLGVNPRLFTEEQIQSILAMANLAER